ncbi:ATP-binding protein [Kutzneria sp. CA-103260]|uniref:ATP-binding protein n=1 Tax=Kutzneria sp. CA-103260 TaxID=2802641 RepID=UPI001BEF4FE9|nr:ATP-binding protein [Kutzneria sp. CA-103260]QUQ65362.1 Histidine kinase-, DNA gyrase B-, and HSP90-like ATPase [Kutzneria sp. CA-103260]
MAVVSHTAHLMRLDPDGVTACRWSDALVTAIELTPGAAAELTTCFRSGGQRFGRRRYGLGLALVNDIADRYDGRLEADSEPGHGATFTLVLPPAERTSRNVRPGVDRASPGS